MRQRRRVWISATMSSPCQKLGCLCPFHHPQAKRAGDAVPFGITAGDQNMSGTGGRKKGADGGGIWRVVEDQQPVLPFRERRQRCIARFERIGGDSCGHAQPLRELSEMPREQRWI